jgi:hypothetical protein
MNIEKIGEQYTFYGILPPWQADPHLAICLSMVIGNITYCYSQTNLHTDLLKDGCDALAVDKKYLIPYFPKDYRNSHIYLSKRHLVEILRFDLEKKLISHEYEERLVCCEDFFVTILDAINRTMALSPRYKKQLMGARYNQDIDPCVASVEQGVTSLS